MDDKTLIHFHDALISHRDSLLDWINQEYPKKKLRLGGAKIKDVLNVVSEIQDALESIDDGGFGKCKECGGDIEIERLTLDFTTQVCLDHYSKDQIHALENDLVLAAKVQKQLLPCCVPSLPDIEIAAYTEPASIVSGDYYDFFGYGSGAQGIAIADVMGKGISASMLVSNLQASLRILGPEYENLNELAVHLNTLFCHNLKLIRFITIFLAKIDTQSRIFQYCNAGHNPVIRVHGSSGMVQLLNPTGPAIGLDNNVTYEMHELKYTLGDLFVFYTDGLVEARNSANSEFGENTLTEYIKANYNMAADGFIEKLVESAKNYAGTFQDDVTLVVIKVK